jgi:hypothetical protein
MRIRLRVYQIRFFEKCLATKATPWLEPPLSKNQILFYLLWTKRVIDE